MELLIRFLPMLLGALTLLGGIGKPARLRAIISYELPVILLVPLALCLLDVWPYSAATEVNYGAAPWLSPLLLALPALCASASALLRGRRGLVPGFIGTLLLFAAAALAAFSGKEGALMLILCPAYLLVLCLWGYSLDRRLSAAPTALSTTPEETKERNSTTMDQSFTPGPALRRGIIGASIGAVALAILFIAIGGTFANVLYGMFCGILGGFGYAFADWSKLGRNTKKAAVEGAAGLGIGVILSRLTDNKNWGMFGWLYFGFRLAFTLGLGWIPGIWRGIQAIRAELKEAPASVPAKNVSKSPAAAPVVPAATLSQQSAAAPNPVLYCLSGVFAGAELPLNSGEVITLGSDPALCQLVLTGEGILPQHCRLGFDKETADWYAVALSGGKVYRDGIRPLNPESVTILPPGTVLSMGQGQDVHRFRLG